ncbi:hypothetical protein L2E82_18650 [Cichorium intybus]|uniref:Uncharacterized protein n=1 Tax=Cichorium intybus TaxID=13427 RepID=A0ACB9FBF7_CICIN|nr:hypothetical protein L2E82_18650 [Cichorium intybus]
MNFLHFRLRRTLPLFIGVHSSWSETEEDDVQSETLDNRPSVLLFVVIMNGSWNRRRADFIAAIGGDFW